MPRADVIEMSRCQSTEMGERIKASLCALHEAGDDRTEQLRYKSLQAIEEAASWARPGSAGGALMHLVLAANLVEDLPRANPTYLEAMERAAERNLYAVRDFLVRLMSDQDRADFQALFDAYMAQDPSVVNPLLAPAGPEQAVGRTTFNVV